MDPRGSWDTSLPNWHSLTDPFGRKMCECVEWFASIDNIYRECFCIWSMASLVIADASYLEKTRHVGIRYRTELGYYDISFTVGQTTVKLKTVDEIRQADLAEGIRSFLIEQCDAP